MNSTSRLMAWCFVGTVGLLMGVYLLMAAAGRGDSSDFHLKSFGQMPVLDHGRVKPIDTLARISLMIISGKQDYKDAEGNTQPATRWLLDVMTASQKPGNPEDGPIRGDSRNVKAYRVDDPAVRKILHLDPQGPEMVSFEEIYSAAGQEGLKDLIGRATDIRRQHPEQRDDLALLEALPTEDRAVYDLSTHLLNHIRFSEFETSHKVFRIDNKDVLAVLGLEDRPGFRYGFDEFLPRLTDLERAAKKANGIKARDRSLFDHKAIETFRHVELYVGVADGEAETLRLIAPADKNGKFMTLRDGLQASSGADPKDPEAGKQHRMTSLFTAILTSYARNKPDQFNEFVSVYLGDYQKAFPSQTGKVTTEASFNAFAPFYVCMILYGILFVSLCVYWVWRDPVVHRFVFWATILTLCVHTWALAMRMHIQGRPPVTNLYSSAVFIGWACVLVTLVVEWIYGNGIAMAVGIVTGGLTLMIAHHLGGSGDTLEMMQAVLDTNFWLATHVTAVTIGYSATFVAGFFGLITVLMVVGATVMRKLGYSAELDYQTMKLLGQCIYGVVCFAMLFSFLGTVLGGIWADASWGRFWGWDPKENGALLIVIMNALILHARWAGMVKERGMAILAMVGNMVTMWSWFGTNQLGIGLHAYGFNNTLVQLCRYFWISQLALIGVALYPFAAWNPAYQPLKRPQDSGPSGAGVPRARGGRGQHVTGGAS